MDSSFKVVTGSQALADTDFARLAGAKVGFLGNHTSRLNDGVSTVSALISSGVCDVCRLFAPEHGAFGVYDEDVADEQDPLSGLTIISLFGENRRPTRTMLSDLDYLVFELQDVGARFYTYSATLLNAIDAAYEYGCKVLLLDRPNPIGGVLFDGPVADADAFSFIAPYSLPIRHGLTLGELGLLYAAETEQDGVFEVVKAIGLYRSSYFDQTGLKWTSPSPAMRSLATAIVYPGVCILEQTNLSVGRGTETPFEVAGAPFINADRWAKAVLEEGIGGVQVTPCTFTPVASKYCGERCHGLKVSVVDRGKFETVRLGIALAATLRNLHPQEFDLMGARNLLANEESLAMLDSGHNSREIAKHWSEQLHVWGERRQPYLLYALEASKDTNAYDRI